MQISDSQNNDIQNSDSESTSGKASQTSKIKRSLSSAQAGFLDFIMLQDLAQLSKSLKLVHDLALYHSDVSINKEEKAALFCLKTLSESFEQIANEV